MKLLVNNLLSKLLHHDEGVLVGLVRALLPNWMYIFRSNHTRISDTTLILPSQLDSIWEFPKIGDPNIVP